MLKFLCCLQQLRIYNGSYTKKYVKSALSEKKHEFQNLFYNLFQLPRAPPAHPCVSSPGPLYEGPKHLFYWDSLARLIMLCHADSIIQVSISGNYLLQCTEAVMLFYHCAMHRK
jgi:hypothetical protein